MIIRNRVERKSNEIDKYEKVYYNYRNSVGKYIYSIKKTNGQ